ncbi:MAG: hypothetical protein AABM40_04640 [Chloroflexota bacterium]
MNEAPTTWALVVGLDVYDLPKIQPLQGAVRDAITAVQWLRKLGVPDGQILLHASPSAGVSAELVALGLSYKPGRQLDISGSMAQLAAVPNGTRLFVFLMGHGLYEPAGGRLFLLQESGVANLWTNAGIDYYSRWLRSLPFPRQYLFVDGCQNYPYGTNERPTISAGFPAGAPNPVPSAANGLVACFAAAQDQYALELGGRGAFSKALFDLLDLNTLSNLPAGDRRMSAIHYDWGTGSRSVDLDVVIDEFVRETVRDVTAPTGNEQRVCLEPGGTAAAEPRHLMVQLPQIPTARIRISVAPGLAVADVASIRVNAPDLFAHCDVPQPPGPLAIPVDLLAPKGIDGDAYCWMQAAAPWTETRVQQRFRTDNDITVAFHLTLQPPPAPPPGAPPPPQGGGGPVGGAPSSTEFFSIKTAAPDGSPVAALGVVHEGYQKVADLAGFLGVLGNGADVGYGVTINLHEDGPVFEVPVQELTRGSTVVHRWAKALRAAVPPDVVVTTRLTGAVVSGDEGRVVFVMPPGGAESIAGALAGHRTVTIHPPGSGEDLPPWRDPAAHSLRDLEARPVVDVRPGPQRVRLELPWGSWSEVLNADPAEQCTVKLPDAVGNPPLRVPLWKEVPHAESALLFVGEAEPSVRLRLSGQIAPVAAPAARLLTADGWRVMLPPAAVTAIVDDGGKQIEFPLLPPRGLGVQRGAAFRVEPLSNIDAAEWDLLVGKGELDSLRPEDAIKLTQQKWFDLLLGLGGAYALYAQRAWGNLGIVTANLQGLGLNVLDVQMLALVAQVQGDLPTSTQVAHALAGRNGQVPVFRWGIRLAKSLTEQINRPGPDLMRWWGRLDHIEQTMARSSVWTTWMSID